MNVEIKKKNKDKTIEELSDIREEVCDVDDINKLYNKKCGNNKMQLKIESENRKELGEHPNDNAYLYPELDDPNFIIKISEKKEFSDTKYDGTIYSVKDYADVLAKSEYELLPQQAFVKNFLSFQTPYNSLLLFHSLGSGKTCSAIGVCEEMRDYLRQMGINKKIIIVASPNVQDNFKLQLFDERKLKEVDGIWTMKGCLSNKLLKEINPTGMKGLKKDKIIQQVKAIISSSYSFQGYLQFSNEIVRKSGKATDSMETKIRNLQNEYSDTLIVIDEVHNIRISDDNENKNVAKNIMYLVSVVSNIRLLLLSATPMFNSYKEIVWLLNLMNMNDRRGIIGISDVFDSNGEFKKDANGNDIGKELLIRKATGYVSHVRGENPYSFPFRVYPNKFAPDSTFKTMDEYPKYQINGRRIADDRKIEKLSLFLTPIGEYQNLGYQYIISRLRGREETTKLLRTGAKRRVAAFSSLKSLGYTDLQIPIEALNIIYPYTGLEEIVTNIPAIEYADTEEQMVEDISPNSDKQEPDMIEEIDSIMVSGPENVPANKYEETNRNSELESEPIVTEGIEADEKLFDVVGEPDIRNIKSIKTNNPMKKTNTIFDEITIDEPIADIKTGKSRAMKEKSFKGTLIKKPTSAIELQTYAEHTDGGIHIIEGITKSNKPKKIVKGGEPNSNDYENLLFDPKELTGTQGLKRIMNYQDTKTPSIKGQFEYKKGVPHVFNKDEIGKYSSKIKNVCNYIFNEKTGEVSEGIILIYSSYIDAGIIPMALALEEMGFTRFGKEGIKPLFKTPPVPIVDVRTMKPSISKKDFIPAKYIMITGDPRISPNNDFELKGITGEDNMNGEKIKVVLISQAGSEGLDFKAIRQIHILEPWYNINRIEQIIGRGVRNFSHKDLPFEKRNVQIFLYGTILPTAEEEAADLYVYRISEIKAVKIGKVTRLLKQTAVDCIINHEQINFTPENFRQIEENRNVEQILSDNQVLKDFEIGDLDNSPTCDFMQCEFDCLPNKKLEDTKLNFDTYNENFMLINSEKIIQKIKNLMKSRYFYKKKDLLHLINTPKPYPISQIYAALTQIINDNTEYIVDKWGRTGYLINIGEYYLFQPSELNYKNISIYDRSVPIDYKHDKIKFEIKSDIIKPVIDKRNINIEEIEQDRFVEGKKVLDTMFENYKLALETTKVKRGNDNWYHHCGVVIRKMSKEGEIIKASGDQERLEILETFLIEHIVDTLMVNEKIDLLNYLNIENTNVDNSIFKRFYSRVKKYLFSKFISASGITGIVLFNGPSRIENLVIYVLNEGRWTLAQPQDKKDLEPAILKKYRLKQNLNRYVGFIGFETNKKYMVYKVKDTKNERSTGFRCDQSGKDKILNILNDIEEDEKYVSKQTKEGAYELCVRQEFTLRNFEREQLEGKTWFLDTETAIINEFEKKEKPK